MKIIVSSYTLQKTLELINFDNDNVSDITIKEDDKEIVLHTRTGQDIRLFAECKKDNYESDFINQDNRRWDCVYDLVKNVSEQPIVLEITENIVNVTFQY